jgi:hypothetical protein
VLTADLRIRPVPPAVSNAHRLPAAHHVLGYAAKLPPSSWRSSAEVEYSPFYGIEKGAVLQEARMFNDRVVDARRCQQVLASSAK